MLHKLESEQNLIPDFRLDDTFININNSKNSSIFIGDLDKNNNTIKILIWTDYFTKSPLLTVNNWLAPAHGKYEDNLFEDCPFNCEFTQDRSTQSDVDALIFHSFDISK